jgi:hypothetical protein
MRSVTVFSIRADPTVRRHIVRRPVPEHTEQPRWEEQPDGSRMRRVNGIRIVDRRLQSRPQPSSPIEHLVASEEEGGRVVIVGLDAACRPVYTTTLYAWL